MSLDNITAKREPTLEDTRDKLEAVARSTRMLLSKVRDLHHILDKDIQGGRTGVVKGEAADKEPIPNLRFDLNNFARNIGEDVDVANKELDLLESKMRNTHPKGASV